MKKLLALTIAAVAGASLLAFAGCANDGSDKTIGTGGLGGGAGTAAEAGVKSAYALGAVTTASLLQQTGGGMALAAAPADGALQEDVGAFSEYFELLDVFLDEGAIDVRVTENTDTSYAFSTKLTVVGALPGGEEASYTMYYTETESRAYEDRDDDEWETGVAYSLEGVLEMNGVAYEMMGFRVSEQEREGREEERSESLWIMARDPADPGSYVRMDVESEEEQEGGEQEQEREFVYRVYRGGRLWEQTSVSFENESERGEDETEYEVSILKDGARSLFSVEREERAGGSASIGVRYSTPDGQGRFIVTKRADGSYVYTFDDGTFFEDDFFD